MGFIPFFSALKSDEHLRGDATCGKALNTFTSFDAPSRDVWVEHALRMRSVVRLLYDG